jgi:NADPH:quinone reductase-like Zn-dependent oxidoreductase
VQIARLFGAKNVIAAGRDADRLAALPALGATATVQLDGGPGVAGAADRLGRAWRVAADVDVVIDYLWGEPAAAAMAALVTHRAERTKPLSWIQIGSVAGPTAPVPSAALRAARLQIVGSGQGSISAREYVAELPAIAQEISAGGLDVDARAVPLADVERVWAAAADARQRIVFIP